MRTWMISIQVGVQIFAQIVFPVFLILSMVMVLYSKKMNLVKFAMKGLFLFYLCCVFGLVFLPLPDMAKAATLTYQTELMPFHFIVNIMEKPLMGTLQVVFNIMMTVPFGMFLTYYFKLDAKRVFLYSLALTTLIEFGQFTGLFFCFPGSYRLFEVDDLICNTLGGMIGYALTCRIAGILPLLENYERSITARRRTTKRIVV